MTPDAYLAARLRAHSSKIEDDAQRPTIATHPQAREIARLIDAARLALDTAAGLLAAPARAPRNAVSFTFIATGRDDAGRDVYAQDEAGTVWAGAAFNGIATAHRFATREDAERIAQTRGGHSYPIPHPLA